MAGNNIHKVGRALCVLVAALTFASTAPEAGWIDGLFRGAVRLGEEGAAISAASRTSSTLTRLGAPAFEDAASIVAKLPKTDDAAALAVHMTPEGHWKFASREGEIFTASSIEELARMPSALVPDTETKPLTLYLSEDAVFTSPGRLAELPGSASLQLVSGTKTFPLIRDGASISAEVRPGVRLALTTNDALREGLSYLSRSLNRSNVRVLALEPTGPKTLPSVPRFDAMAGKALVDSIDPTSLGDALSKIKGQTALISGRVDGDVLTFLPASGSEQKLFITEVVRAAETTDVNLVILNAAGPRQPGGTNWLWQTVKVANLDEAMARATNADFMAALAGGSKPLVISATESNSGRILVTARPADGGVAAPLENTMSEWMGELTGHVATRSIDVYARAKSRDDELDARFISGIPSAVQVAVLVSAILGILTWPISWGWWSRIWPDEERSQYASATGHVLARGARLMAFILIFAPLVGVPAFLWVIMLQIWTLITAPVRALRWLKARLLMT